MTVQARVRLTSKTEINATDKLVKLNPVYSSDPDSPNYSFSKYTPSGEISLYITNPAAHDYFEDGKEYDVFFKEVVSGT